MLEMKFKEYFDVELRTAVINVIAGAVVGYISFVVNQPLTAFFIAIIFVALLSLILGKAFGVKKGAKWWVSNGVIIFLLTWFVVWTIFYDIRLFSTLPR